MGVVVNEPGRNHPTIGIDGASRRIIELADPHYLTVLHGYIAVEGGFTRAVNYAPVLYE